jgi:hypothetical protein
MKKIVFLGLILLLVASSTGFSQNIPLPKDIVIKPPSPELPKEIAAFSGRWKGTWSGGGADFILVVTEISLGKAEIVYANSEGQYIPEACDPLTAKVIPGDSPKIQFNRIVRLKARRVLQPTFQYSFEMQKNLKTIKGILKEPKSTSNATLEKVQLLNLYR